LGPCLQTQSHRLDPQSVRDLTIACKSMQKHAKALNDIFALYKIQTILILILWLVHLNNYRS
jgi:hypothetical protein